MHLYFMVYIIKGFEVVDKLGWIKCPKFIEQKHFYLRGKETFPNNKYKNDLLFKFVKLCKSPKCINTKKILISINVTSNIGLSI